MSSELPGWHGAQKEILWERRPRRDKRESVAQ
jgi:hypothetical protein